ncbi:hypothetical protein BJ742DRAFT_366736 [Cladochytrium replicatum]|nr:hypothetical protein BJ742DRAFT_366736 [Cladochytrium replicatum]
MALDETTLAAVWCVLGFCILAFIFFIGAFISNVRRYKEAARNQPNGRWTRFHKMMMVCVLFQLLGATLAIAMMFMMLLWFPDHMDASIACTRLTFDLGPARMALSIMEVMEQVLLELGSECNTQSSHDCRILTNRWSPDLFYFIVLMDRYYTFRLFIPGGNSAIVRRTIYSTGIFLYLVTIAQIVVANTGDRSLKLTKSNPHCIAAFVMQLGFVDMIGGVDIMVAYHLSLVALGLDQHAKIRSWSILKGSRSGSRSGASGGNTELSPIQSAGEYNSFNKLAYPNSPITSDANGSTQPFPHHRPSLTVYQRIMLTPHRRRVVFLVIVALSMDMIALALCILPLVSASIGQVTRAFELIAVHLVLMHILASLWFLESFKEVVLAPKPWLVGAALSSVTVGPQPVEKYSGSTGSHPRAEIPKAFAFEQRAQASWNRFSSTHGAGPKIYGVDVGSGANGSNHLDVGASPFGSYPQVDPGPSPFSGYPQAELYGANRYPRKLSIGREMNVDPGPSPYSPGRQNIEHYAASNGQRPQANGFVNHWG